MKFEKPDILARWYPSEVSLEGEELLSGAQKPQKRRPMSNAYWVFAWVLSISASCSLTWSLARNSCHLSSFDDTSVADQVASLNWYSPVYNNINLSLEHVHLDGELWWNASNIYRQDPSPEVDEAWANLYYSNANRVFVSEEDAIKMGWDLDILVKWPDDPTGRTYVAEMNVFHLVHCVNVLRQGAFLDYYWYKRPIDPSYWTHFYHCLDMIRQEIMCTASLDLNPLVWVDSQNKPFPNFAIDRVCRRWEDVVHYREEFGLTDAQIHTMTHDMRKQKSPHRRELATPPEAKKLFRAYAKWKKLDFESDFTIIEPGDYGRTSDDPLGRVQPNPKSG
ncbi:UstYa family oxidase [Sphaerulina musiva]